MNTKGDKNYEALLENYEDAMIRLVMYRAGREYGKRLLDEAEALNNSGFEVPKELDEKCLKLIQDGCASMERNRLPTTAGDRGNKSTRRFRLQKIGQIFVAAILAAVLLFCVAYAANEQFRVNVLNFFLEARENGTWFSFGSKEVQPNLSGASLDEDFPFEFTYIPEGFELIVQEARDLKENGIDYLSRYGRPNDEYCNFLFDISPISESTGMLVDTENAEVTNTSIHGHDGWIIKKVDVPSGKECTMYLWLDLENGYSYEYCSIGIPDDELQKIFENIVINKRYLEHP